MLGVRNGLCVKSGVKTKVRRTEYTLSNRTVLSCYVSNVVSKRASDGPEESTRLCILI